MRKVFFLTSLLLHTALPTFAGISTYQCSSSPVSMLEDISNNLIKEYREKEKTLRSKDEVKAYALQATQDAVMPSLDAEYMAKQIVGRYNWNAASKSEKADFIKAYQRALASEYSKFLLKTSKKENYLKFYPSRKGSKSQTVVLATVDSRKKKSTIGFYLHCVDNTMIDNLPYQTWMIYDITIDNISYLDQFKVSVSSTVRNSGLKGLTEKINEYTSKKPKSSHKK